MCKCDGIYDDNYAFFTTYHLHTQIQSQTSSPKVKKRKQPSLVQGNLDLDNS